MTRPSVETLRVEMTSHKLVEVTWRNIPAQRLLKLSELDMRTIDVLIGLVRTNRIRHQSELQVLGERLFVALFGHENEGVVDEGEYTPLSLIKAAINRDLDTAGPRLLKVTVNMDVENNQYAGWPWEYLYVPKNSGDPNSGFFLNNRANLVLSRNVPLKVEPRKIKVDAPLKILFAAITPLDRPLEYEALLEQLKALRDGAGYRRQSPILLRVFAPGYDADGRKLEDDDDSGSRTTYEDFLGAVDEFGPHVIHILAHGRYEGSAAGVPCGQLAFTSRDSTAHWIADKDLSDDLMDVESLKLVFLQSCASADTSAGPYQVISGVAQWLAQRNIPAVIAMHFDVNSGLANDFAGTFYDRVVGCETIELAMHAARRGLRNRGVSEGSAMDAFGLPVLYLRGSGAILSPLESAVSTSEATAESRSVADAEPVPGDRHIGPPSQVGTDAARRPSSLVGAGSDLSRRPFEASTADDQHRR